MKVEILQEKNNTNFAYEKKLNTRL